MYINRRNLVGGVTGSAQSLGSAAAIASVQVGSQVAVRQLQFKIKTALVTTGTPQLDFYARTLPGTTAGQVLLGSIKFVTADAAGVVRFKDITPALVPAGWFVEAVVSTATAGGGAAGDGWIALIVEDSPEVDKNNSLFVASA